MGWRGAFLSYRRNGLVVEIKHKSIFSDLSTVGNGYLLATLGSKAFLGFHNIPALFHLAKDHMLAIQPVLAVQMKNWELFVVGPPFAMDKMPGAICFRMKFSSKILPIDGFGVSAIMASEVVTLVHKPQNNPVKAGTLIAKSFLPST